MAEHETLADAATDALGHDVLADGDMALYAEDVGTGTQIVAVNAYLANAQTGAEPLARALIYDADGNLQVMGATTPVDNVNPEWVHLPLLDAYPGGVPVSGTVRFGLQVTGGVEVYGEEDGGGLRANSAWADEPDPLPATSPDLTPALVVPYIEPWTPPTDVDSFTLARLGFPSAQAALGCTAADPRTRQTAWVSWHGTYLDPESQGASFAIVQRDGPLADLVGRRIKVTEPRGGKFVYAFVHREADLDLADGEQISLTRRLYRALAPLATDALLVTVEELGPEDC